MPLLSGLYLSKLWLRQGGVAMEFTHFNENGEAVMVDVGGKEDTVREASAGGRISMTRECLERVSTGRIKKGDVLGVARIAGIMALKQTSNIIPLCHLMNLTYADTDHRQNRCGDGSADRRIRRSPDNLRYVQGCGQDNDNRRDLPSPQIRRKKRCV